MELDKSLIVVLLAVLGYTATLGLREARNFFDEIDYKAFAGISIACILIGILIPDLVNKVNPYVSKIIFSDLAGYRNSNMTQSVFLAATSLYIVLCFFIKWAKNSLRRNRRYRPRCICQNFCFILYGVLLLIYGFFSYHIIVWEKLLQSYQLLLFTILILFAAGIILGIAHLSRLKKYTFHSQSDKPLFNGDNVLTGYKIDESKEYYIIKPDGIPSGNLDYKLVKIRKEQIIAEVEEL
ncbi:MAG TPA: hypothetical protein PKA10_13960 [Selenomonadales bacterium]|nr:hypothetical protein [Selenomonadales bacterium]